MSLVQSASSSRTIRLVFLEAFLIVFGVVVAYSFTAWNDAQKEKEAAALALGSILEELAENRSSVLSSLEYHNSIRNTLFGAIQSQTKPRRPDFPLGYVRPAELLTTAWDLAHARGAIAQLPYEEVLELSRMYFDQESYAATSREVGGLIYAAIFNEGSGSILERYPNLLEVVMTFLFRECQLLVHHGEVLTDFGVTPTPAEEVEAGCQSMLDR